MANAQGLSIFFRDKTKKSIGDVYIDVAVTEDYSFESEVTQFPIETGAAVSDFIRNKPDRFSIQGFVTNSPVQILGGSIGDLVRGTVNNSVELTFEQLERLHRNREPVVIVAGLKTYENMAIERLTIPRSRETGDAISFTIEAVQISKADSILVELPNLSQKTTGAEAGSAELGASKVDKGAQVAKDADTNTTKKTSLLKKGIDGAFGFFGRG